MRGFNLYKDGEAIASPSTVYNAKDADNMRRMRNRLMVDAPRRLLCGECGGRFDAEWDARLGYCPKGHANDLPAI